MVHSLLGDVISFLLAGLPIAGLPSCYQGLCEDTCAISAVSFTVDFWMSNRYTIMAVDSELNSLNIGSERSSYFND
jgi:hypothetical protein